MKNAIITGCCVYFGWQVLYIFGLVERNDLVTYFLLLFIAIVCGVGYIEHRLEQLEKRVLEALEARQ